MPQSNESLQWPGDFLNGPVAIYLLLVVVAQIGVNVWFWWRRERVARKRARVGLPADVIMGHAERASRVRLEAGLQAGVLLVTVFVVPLALVWFAQDADKVRGVLLVFVVLLAWLLLQGTDVAKAFLGGLAFKTLAAFQCPIQVGDRVILKGQHGKVEHIGLFFVTLQTSDDDRISIPTRELWSEVLVSTNAGERSSLCVMAFYLAPFVTIEQR